MHLRGGLNYLIRAAQHILVCLGRLAAHLKLKLGRVAHDVAPRADVQRAGVYLRGRIAEAGNGVQVQHSRRRGEQRIPPLLRGKPGMGRNAGERDVQLRRGKAALRPVLQNADVNKPGRLSGG